jgi:hypothetical protein
MPPPTALKRWASRSLHRTASSEWVRWGNLRPELERHLLWPPSEKVRDELPLALAKRKASRNGKRFLIECYACAAQDLCSSVKDLRCAGADNSIWGSERAPRRILPIARRYGVKFGSRLTANHDNSPAAPLSQRGAYWRQRFKDHPRFRRPTARYRVHFMWGQLTSTITGPEFVCSGFSRHMPANFAFAINALTAAAETVPFVLNVSDGDALSPCTPGLEAPPSCGAANDSDHSEPNLATVFGGRVGGVLRGKPDHAFESLWSVHESDVALEFILCEALDES